jgi:hypothetical protein
MRTLIALLLTLCAALRAGPALADAHAGRVDVQNDRHELVRVLLDQHTLGLVPAYTAGTFLAPVGRHDLLVLDRQGRRLEQASIHVHPNRAVSVVVGRPSGRISVDNRSGARLSLTLDGVPAGSLDPGEERLFEVAVGEHALVARYRQLGQDRLLGTQEVDVCAGELERTAFLPVERGLARVVNHTDSAVQILVDGQGEVWLAPGASREIVVSLGTVRLVALLGGQALDTALVTVSRYEDVVWSVDVPTRGRPA